VLVTGHLHADGREGPGDLSGINGTIESMASDRHTARLLFQRVNERSYLLGA